MKDAIRLNEGTTEGTSCTSQGCEGFLEGNHGHSELPGSDEDQQLDSKVAIAGLVVSTGREQYRYLTTVAIKREALPEGRRALGTEARGRAPGAGCPADLPGRCAAPRPCGAGRRALGGGQGVRTFEPFARGGDGVRLFRSVRVSSGIVIAKSLRAKNAHAIQSMPQMEASRHLPP